MFRTFTALDLSSSDKIHTTGRFLCETHLFCANSYDRVDFPFGKFYRSYKLIAQNIPEREIAQVMASIRSPQQLGAALRTARKQLGLTQPQLALAAGVGVRFIVDLEAGKATVRLENVLRVIDALGGEILLNGLPSGAVAKQDEECGHGA
jgi:y4mF family transcriptional regulator